MGKEITEDRITLDINSPAPIFRLKDIFDRDVDLNTYKGKKVLIAFFRHAGCPFCNTRVHSLQKRHQEFKDRGLEMIFFFESSKETLLASHFHKSVSPIPIIADPEKEWYTKYGIEQSALKSVKSRFTSFFVTVVEAKLKKLPAHSIVGKESINTIPAEFLMNERGFIKKIHYSKGLRQRMSLDEIENFIAT